MKFNKLLSFRAALAKSFAPSTAHTYYKAIDYLLKDQLLIDCNEIDIKKVVHKLKSIKYKSYYSKYKNAFLKFCDYLDITLTDNTLTELDKMKNEKLNKYRQLKSVKLKDIKNHIKVIRDKKLKLSYQTMLATGLRVSELSQVKKDDCKIKHDCLELHFIGKGGQNETVKIDDKKLMVSLTELIGLSDKEKYLFYSNNYLQSKAHNMGFQCHDLRRAFAKITYQKYHDISMVMDLMRHSELKSTKIYLQSKVVI